jgi:hypothetical protein
MGGIKLPGLVVVIIAAVLTALTNYFSAGGAGFEWLYAPIALSVLGVIAKAIAVQAPPPVTPQADFGGPLPERDSKMKRLLLG